MRSIVALSLLVLAVNARFVQECFNTPDGLYPLGPCEPRFLTCSGGIARVMDCPADLIYRDDGEFCDWRENVVGCGAAGDAYGADNRQADEASGDVAEDVVAETSTEASGDVYQQTPIEAAYPDPSYGEASAEVANDAPVETTEAPTTTQETTTDGAYVQIGSDDQTVSSDDARAASPEEASGSVPEPDNVCENREDGVYSDGGCTTLYHICTANTARFVNCPTPLLFDSENQKCTWGTHIEACKYHTAPVDEPAADEQSGDGSGDVEPSCDGKEDGIYPNGVCSTNFLTCSGGIARVMNCPSSLVFNPSIHVCDWARDVAECSGLPKPQAVCEEDGYFSFGQCSSSFTACTNGRAIVMFCPAGLKFAQSTQRCEYEVDAAECQKSSDQPSVSTTEAYAQSDDSSVTTPVYERASDDTVTTPAAVYEQTTEEATTSAVYVPVSDETSAPTTEVYEQTTEEVPLTTETPASDEPSTTTTASSYEQTTVETAAPTTEAPVEPASDEPSTTTEAYEQPTEGTIAPTTEATYVESSDATPAAETYERSADEASATAPEETYEQVTEETTVATSEPETTPAADETTVTTPVALYEQTTEEVATTTTATEEVASDEGSAEEQNACTGLADGFYSVGCSPRALSCKNGKEGSFECPSHLVFNEQTSICDYPQTSLKCQYEEQPVEDTPATPFECSSDGLFSDSLCSASYHQCSAGHLINFTCAEANAVFSAAEASCVDQSTLLQCKSLSSPY